MESYLFLGVSCLFDTNSLRNMDKYFRNKYATKLHPRCKNHEEAVQEDVGNGRSHGGMKNQNSGVMRGSYLKMIILEISEYEEQLKNNPSHFTPTLCNSLVLEMFRP